MKNRKFFAIWIVGLMVISGLMVTIPLATNMASATSPVSINYIPVGLPATDTYNLGFVGVSNFTSYPFQSGLTGAIVLSGFPVNATFYSNAFPMYNNQLDTNYNEVTYYTVTHTSNIVVYLNFSKRYAVTFQALNPDSSHFTHAWNLTINGSVNLGGQSGTYQDTQYLPNGSYNWKATSTGYETWSSYLTVSGQALTVIFYFYPTNQELNITFTESGLPLGTNWNISVYYANPTSLILAQTNISVPSIIIPNFQLNAIAYCVAVSKNYNAQTVNFVTNSNYGTQTVNINFSQTTYSVTFNEFNAPMPPGYYLNITGTENQNYHPQSAADTSYVVYLVKGNYSYVATANGFLPLTGTFSLTGALTITLAFQSGTSIKELVPIESIPIVIQNTEPIASPTTFDQLIQLNGSQLIQSGATTSFGDIGFSLNKNFSEPLYSWLFQKQGTGTNGNWTMWFVKMPQSIPAFSGLTIYVEVFNQTVNFYGSSNTSFYVDNYAGQYPTFSSPYGINDNGAIVFPYYSNLQNTSGWSIKTGTISDGITAVFSGRTNASFNLQNQFLVVPIIHQPTSRLYFNNIVGLWNNSSNHPSPNSKTWVQYYEGYYPDGGPSEQTLSQYYNSNNQPVSGGGYGAVKFNGHYAGLGSSMVALGGYNKIGFGGVTNYWQSSQYFGLNTTGTYLDIYAFFTVNSVYYGMYYYPTAYNQSTSVNLTFVPNGLPSGDTYNLAFVGINYTRQYYQSGQVTLTGFPIYSSFWIDVFPMTSTRQLDTNVSELTIWFTTYNYNARVWMNFSARYNVTFAAYLYDGIPFQGAWNLSLTGAETLGSQSGSYLNYQWLINGSYNYVATSVGYNRLSGSLTETGQPLFIKIYFYPTNNQVNVTFTEYGLASGTQWNITIYNANPTYVYQTVTGISTTSKTITGFSLNTLMYVVGSAKGYSSVTVNFQTLQVGGLQYVNLVFNASSNKQFAVTFKESGLPSGTLYSINVTGTQSASTVTEFNTSSFALLNGTYYYVAHAKGYKNLQNSFVIQGANVTIYLMFSSANGTLSVTFVIVGYPSQYSYDYSVQNVNGSAYLNRQDNVFAQAFTLNGFYKNEQYSVYVWPNYHQYQIKTVFFNLTTVNATTDINMQTAFYVNITERGLPSSGQHWYVSITGPQNPGKQGQVTPTDWMNLTLIAGTYFYNATSPSYQTMGGQFVITTSGVTVTLTFVKNSSTALHINFVESGLPTGTKWFITVNGSYAYNSTSNVIVVANYTGRYVSVSVSTLGSKYMISINGVGGTEQSGIPISGNTTIRIVFSTSGTGGIAPYLNMGFFYAIIILGVLALGVFFTYMFWKYRAR